MDFVNCYDNATRADAYSKLEFANTYHLAFRDLPEIFRAHVKGISALDFGCGTGRSTRFLCGLGFETVGVDISPHHGFYGVVRFAEAARVCGLPTIFGTEVTLAPAGPRTGEPDPRGTHLVVLARDPEGYASLSSVMAEA